MEKREAWFWIFAIIQGIMIFGISRVLNDMYGLLILEEQGVPLVNFIWNLAFAISTIGIEYLIFSKK